MPRLYLLWLIRKKSKCEIYQGLVTSIVKVGFVYSCTHHADTSAKSGDMNLPSCLLCVRTNTSCVFPDGRKRRRTARQTQVSEHIVLGGALTHAGKYRLKVTVVKDE
jgi:hypothetical protein